MKNGQMFTFDVLFAFLGMCCIAVIFFANFSIIVHQTKEDYDSFILQKKLFDASEFLIQDDGSHHELSIDKIKASRDKLLLDDYDFQIIVKTESGRILLDEGPEIKGLSVKRIALCRGWFGNEPCILEIKAKA